MKHISFITTLILSLLTYYMIAIGYEQIEDRNVYEPFLYKYVGYIETIKQIELKPEPKLKLISFVASVFTGNKYEYVYAQLHLESNGGRSRRAIEDNNYAGIKCYTRNSEGVLFKNDIEFLLGNRKHEGYISMMRRLYHRTMASKNILEYGNNLYFYDKRGNKKTYARPMKQYVVNLKNRYKCLREMMK